MQNPATKIIPHCHPGESRDPYDVSTGTISQKSALPYDPIDSGLRRNDNCENDRLSAAINFLARLSESRLREMALAYKRRWTGAKRAEKARIIQTHKPWTRRRRSVSAQLEREMKAAMRAQDAWRRDVQRAVSMQKRGFPWPEDRLCALHAQGRIITARLHAVLGVLLVTRNILNSAAQPPNNPLITIKRGTA